MLALRHREFALVILSLLPMTLFHVSASFEDLQVDHYEEQLTITLPGFIAQIGGQLGLFLGISVITMLQVPSLYAFQLLAALECWSQVCMHVMDPIKKWVRNRRRASPEPDQSA